jgi:hypothetical protein
VRERGDKHAKFSTADHGFHFSNTDITWTIRTPDFLIITGTELCGGMVYSALDYFQGYQNSHAEMASVLNPRDRKL